MSEPRGEGKRFNRIVVVGMWMTLAVILFWAGGEAYMKVVAYLPWALALGVLVLVLGLLIQYRKPKATNGDEPKQ